jgi:hypothetical protein
MVDYDASPFLHKGLMRHRIHEFMAVDNESAAYSDCAQRRMLYVFGVLDISLDTGWEGGNFNFIEPRRLRKCLRLTRTPDSRGLLVPSNTRNPSFWYRCWLILIRS